MANESDKLLTAEEQKACQEIASAGKELVNQRAAALLVIDGGATRVQASEQTGLTVGQIGYLLTSFRKKRMAMFPDTEASEAEEPEEEAQEEKAKKAKKKAKPKKGKKAKKKKKPKAKKAQKGKDKADKKKSKKSKG